MSISTPGLSLNADDVQEGSIIWLGTWEETLESYRRRGNTRGTPISCTTGTATGLRHVYGHPIIVLSRSGPDPSKIYFVQMTSHGSSTTLTKHRKRYVPITPAPTHPYYDTGIPQYATLTLQNGDGVMKPSWADIGRIYKMDWHDAQRYWGANPTIRKAWILDGPSLRALKRLLRAWPTVPCPMAANTLPILPPAPHSQVTRTFKQEPVAAHTSPLPTFVEVRRDSLFDPATPPSTMYQGFLADATTIRTSAHANEEDESRVPLPVTQRPGDSPIHHKTFWQALWCYLKATQFVLIIRYICGRVQ